MTAVQGVRPMLLGAEVPRAASMPSSGRNVMGVETGQLAADYSGIVAAAAVFLYDTIITTGEEIRCFWGRKITGAVILFWLNKYMTMLVLVWGLATGLNISNESCARSVKGSATVQILLFIVQGAFTAIRVYALRRSFTLCAVTAFLSFVPFGINFATIRFGFTGEKIPILGCIQIDNVPIDLYRKCKENFKLASKLRHLTDFFSRHYLSVMPDCSVTWFTLGLRFPTSRGGILKGSITSVFLLDGTIYFLLPAILVSRFLLHLQSASLRGVGSIPSSQISSLHLDRSLVLERVVGSLGVSIAAEDYFMEDSGDGDNGERADESTPSQTLRE
ncbi:hypothetical protein BD309DRAFT_983110 [Dichomitus squalens]|nr:hypothetical protein BD309DRAFT_983110 [Dichomitus squalens]